MTEQPTRPGLFSNDFEDVWTEFDREFKSSLMCEVQQLGSLYRTSLSREELTKEMGARFYRALEETLDTRGFLAKFKSALQIAPPASFDEVLQILGASNLSPLHAFMVLLMFVHEHPLRAFFSGRDEALPFNTVALAIRQSPGDRVPRSVAYSLSHVPLSTCPYDTELADKDDKKKEHPKNHWVWENDPDYDDFPTGITIWVWHF